MAALIGGSDSETPGHQQMVTQSVSPGAVSSSTSAGIGERDDASTELVHASAVRLLGKGVLLLGPSTSGKSDLALRLIDAGAVLIADDQVRLSLAGDRLRAGPPACLAGLIELRGMGIMRVPFEEGLLDLAVDLKTSSLAAEPLPEPATVSWLGIDLPKIELDSSAPSAVARIKMALNAERIF